MIYLKKAKTATMRGIIVATALVILMASFPNVVNATEEVNNEETSAVSTENKIAKKERKGKRSSSEKKAKFENLTDEEKEAINAERKAKYENMTDEEKEALKAKRETKKAEKKTKYENLTDEEKEALTAEKEAKKIERKAKFESMTDEEKEALKNKKPEKKERKNNNAVNSQSSEQ